MRKPRKARRIDGVTVKPRAHGIKAVLLLDDGTKVKMGASALAAFVSVIGQTADEMERAEAEMESKVEVKH